MKNYLEYNGYLGSVQYTAEDEVFYGKLEGIEDLVTFEADTVLDLKRGFQEAVDDYLETCTQLNKKPNKTYKGGFNVRTSQDLHQKITEIALKRGLKLNELINASLYYLVKNEDRILGR